MSVSDNKVLFLPALAKHVHCVLGYEVGMRTLRRHRVVWIRPEVHSESFGSCRVHHSIWFVPRLLGHLQQTNHHLHVSSTDKIKITILLIHCSTFLCMLVLRIWSCIKISKATKRLLLTLEKFSIDIQQLERFSIKCVKPKPKQLQWLITTNVNTAHNEPMKTRRK